jgi:hypothetical protein
MRRLIDWAVPSYQLPYLRSHPLAACVSFGLAFAGVLSVVRPELVAESVVAQAFPRAAFYLFSTIWAVGGTCAWFGIMRGHRSVEAGGSALLAGGLIVYFGAVISIRPSAGVSGAFILFLALGYAGRAYHLATSGYEELHR